MYYLVFVLLRTFIFVYFTQQNIGAWCATCFVNVLSILINMWINRYTGCNANGTVTHFDGQ